MKKYLSELIGTFALVFCGTGAIIINDVTGGQIGNIGIAITFGLIVMAMIYAFGDISGAHLNPAVTIAFYFSGRFSGKEVLPYMLSQLAGALMASLVLKVMFPASLTLGTTIPVGDPWVSFWLEIILAFILMLVIIQVTTSRDANKGFAGLIIGGVILLEAAFAGPVSGASMNPFRSLAPALMSGQTQFIWIYLAAPVLGAIASIFVCVLTREQACCPDSVICKIK